MRRDIRTAQRIWMRAGYQARRIRELGSGVTISRMTRSVLTKYRHLVWALTQRLGLRIRDPRGANFAAGSRYTPRPYPGRITLLEAADQPPWREIEPGGGWARVAEQGVETHSIPGHHTGLYREPSVAVLAETLKDCLARARGAS
jgi:thioesterase domain-containing protein